MATYVLVHGSWLGSWSWSEVRARLEAAGHQVHSPTLSGVADRHHLHDEQIGLHTHAQDVSRLLVWEDLEDIVLVGHSYGGMVITEALGQIAARVRHLVYLDAFTPVGGQSAFDVLPFLADVLTAPDNEPWAIEPLPAAAMGVDDALLAAHQDARVTSMSRRTHSEKVSLSSDPHLATIPKTFVHFSGQPFFAGVVPDLPGRGFTVVDLPAGHMAVTTAPEDVARLLLAVL